MSHMSIYRPKAARPVTFEDGGGGYVEITDERGSTINVWLPAGTENAVADGINGALKAEASE